MIPPRLYAEGGASPGSSPLAQGPSLPFGVCGGNHDLQVCRLILLYFENENSHSKKMFRDFLFLC
jgi:hypothetical protein